MANWKENGTPYFRKIQVCELLYFGQMYGSILGAMQNSWANCRSDPFVGSVECTQWPALWRTTFVKNAGYIYGEIGVCLIFPHHEMRRFWLIWELSKTSWWFQIFFILTNIWGRCPIWLIFFKGVETTNQKNIQKPTPKKPFGGAISDGRLGVFSSTDLMSLHSSLKICSNEIIKS